MSHIRAPSTGENIENGVQTCLLRPVEEANCRHFVPFEGFDILGTVLLKMLQVVAF